MRRGWPHSGTDSSSSNNNNNNNNNNHSRRLHLSRNQRRHLPLRCLRHRSHRNAACPSRSPCSSPDPGPHSHRPARHMPFQLRLLARRRPLPPEGRGKGGSSQVLAPALPSASTRSPAFRHPLHRRQPSSLARLLRHPHRLKRGRSSSSRIWGDRQSTRVRITVRVSRLRTA